mgnify:CR=1 FL=1|jgi:hypothetical protein
MKRYLFFSILFFSINASSQILNNTTQYLRIAENQVNSDPFLNFEDFKFNSKRRVLECNIQFRDGTKNFNPKCTTCWNKILVLSCTMNNGTKNSIRIGWRYSATYDKIELGYYGHMNHLQSPWGDDPGREYATLGVFVDTWENIHVELVLSKGFYYVRAGDVAMQVHRDVFSWDENGENSVVCINAWFGDKGNNYVWNGDDLSAPEDMEFRVSEILIDNNNYFSNFKHNKAPIYKLANSVFYNDQNSINYEATTSLEISTDMESNEATSRIPYNYINDKFSFVVFQNGSNVNCYSPNIYLYPGTVIEKGANVYFGPINSLKSDEISLIENSVDEPFIENKDVKLQNDDVILTNKSKNINIFPNPTSDFLHITTPLSNGKYIISDSNGKLISIGTFYTNSFSIDCTSYDSGIYLITCELGNYSITKQFILK